MGFLKILLQTFLLFSPWKLWVPGIQTKWLCKTPVKVTCTQTALPDRSKPNLTSMWTNSRNIYRRYKCFEVLDLLLLVPADKNEANSLIGGLGVCTCSATDISMGTYPRILTTQVFSINRFYCDIQMGAKYLILIFEKTLLNLEQNFVL